MNIKIVAIVPMRHSSERVIGKNYRPFAGRPLYHCVIESLLKCHEVTDVVIDTDSVTIKNDSLAFFPSVTVLERPVSLRDGSIPMNNVLLHTTGKIEADYFLQTHSTNPLLTAKTISGAISTFLANVDKYDSLFSVKRLQTRLWSGEGLPLNHDLDKLMRTQDLAPVFEENSCIYMFSRKTLEQQGNRIGKRPMMYEMNPVESLDIDEEVDFKVAELIYLNRGILGDWLS